MLLNARRNRRLRSVLRPTPERIAILFGLILVVWLVIMASG